MTLFAVSQAIRKAGGQVILCGNQPFGYVFRAEIDHKHCRIIIPYGKQPAQYPPEANTLTYVTSDAQSLQT